MNSIPKSNLKSIKNYNFHKYNVIKGRELVENFLCISTKVVKRKLIM